jgi:superfamily II DNA helicase RecQ
LRRVSPDELPIDFGTLERRAERELEKLARMEEYATRRVCRRAALLRYFGAREVPNRCNACDICRQWDAPGA